MNVTEDEYEVWNSNQKRTEKQEEFNRFLQSKIEQFDRDYLIENFEKQSIPYSEILTFRELFNKPEIKDSNYTDKVKSKNYNQELEYVKHPVNISNTDHSHAEFVEPPLLGQHTDQILSELVGYSDDHIKELKFKGII